MSLALERDKKLTTIIMAGGKGERLFPLTRDRAKPAVAIIFGGLYRIIDFTLSNCLNSGIRRIYVLSQYGSLSLDIHLRLTWDIFRPDLGEYIYSVPPQQITVNRWYRGTADSIYQNLKLLDEERPKHVLILSGDHVYKMDYRPPGKRPAPSASCTWTMSTGSSVFWKNLRTRPACPATRRCPWCPWGSISLRLRPWCGS